MLSVVVESTLSESKTKTESWATESKTKTDSEASESESSTWIFFFVTV